MSAQEVRVLFMHLVQQVICISEMLEQLLFNII